jgi:hypothetical protein
MTARHHGSIHGAGRCARYCFDYKPALLEQAVKHTPGERAVRTTTLQRQVDELRWWLDRHGYSLEKSVKTLDRHGVSNETVEASHRHRRDYAEREAFDMGEDRPLLLAPDDAE